jgi:hypothetical protein
VERPASFVEDQHRIFADPHRVAVRVDDPVLRSERFARERGSLAFGRHPVEILGVDGVRPRVGPAQEPLPGDTQQIDHAGAHVDHRLILVHAIDVEDGRQVVDDPPVAELELTEAVVFLAGRWVEVPLPGRRRVHGCRLDFARHGSTHHSREGGWLLTEASAARRQDLTAGSDRDPGPSGRR